MISSKEDERAAMDQSHSNRSNSAVLVGTEIQERLAGNKIAPDPAKRENAFQFAEYFYAGGRWRSVRHQRGLTEQSGYWKVDGDKICVKVDGKPDVCRSVYRTDKKDRLLISDKDSGPYSETPITVVVSKI